MESAAITAFWDAYLRQLPPDTSRPAGYYEAFYFGNDKQSANELADLVLRGIKTATSSLPQEFAARGKAIVKRGDLSIVTTWDGEPVCVMETTDVRILPFRDVDAAFAYDYGEGDRTLAWWQRAIWDSYLTICADLGLEASQDMPLVCEQFRVVFGQP